MLLKTMPVTVRCALAKSTPFLSFPRRRQPHCRKTGPPRAREAALSRRGTPLAAPAIFARGYRQTTGRAYNAPLGFDSQQATNVRVNPSRNVRLSGSWVPLGIPFC